MPISLGCPISYKVPDCRFKYRPQGLEHNRGTDGGIILESEDLSPSYVRKVI